MCKESVGIKRFFFWQVFCVQKEMKINTLFEEISNLDTEQINPAFSNLDISNTEEILKIINSEDALISAAVKQEIPYITLAVEQIVKSFQTNGHLFYIGAGTSGRLGVLDASECPPTFGVSPDLVQGFIAGGKEAAFRAIEGAEDLPESGVRLIEEIGVSERDVVCGLAASGRTPFVLKALESAKQRNATTVLITTNRRAKMLEMKEVKHIDILICPYVGAEVIAGSTRMKSGTAQKMVLNMLTTTAMIKIGKTYGNIMVDLMPTNNKLRERAKRILMLLTDCSLQEAEDILLKTHWRVKEALVMLLADVDLEVAEKMLKKHNGLVKEAVTSLIK